jgi:hypothetical protein
MLPSMKEMLGDERVWGVACRVAVHRGQDSHFTLSEGQVHVSVITLTHGQEIWAVLQGASRSGRGMWRIPDLGTEVFVMFSDGEFEGDPYIAGFYGRAPDGLIENVTLILDDKVEIRSLDGVAHKLPYLSELQTLYDFVQAQFNAALGHTHVVTGVTVGAGTATTAAIALASGSAMPTDPTGTTCVEVE